MSESASTRQGEVERRTAVHFRIGPDAAAVPVNDAADMGEADAGTFEFIILMKPLKDPEEIAGVAHVESGAIVAYKESALALSGLAADLDDRRRPLAGVLDRVAQQVQPDETKRGQIASDFRKRRNLPVNLAAGRIRFE